MIPFTNGGMLEGETRRITTETPGQAWRRVIDETAGLTDGDRALALSGQVLVRPPGAYRPGLHITARRRVVALQGGWWYRGVTCVEPHPGGALVTYAVINVAPGWGKWLAHFFQAREHRKRMAAPRAEVRDALARAATDATRAVARQDVYASMRGTVAEPVAAADGGGV